MNDFLIGNVLYNVYKLLQDIGVSLDFYFYAVSLVLVGLAIAMIYFTANKAKLKSTKALSFTMAVLLSLLSFQTFAITNYADKDLAQFIIKASANDVANNLKVQPILNKYESIASKKENEIRVSNILAYHYDIRIMNETKK